MNYCIDLSVFNEIIDSIGKELNESGGLLGGQNRKYINRFYFDKGNAYSVDEYVPNAKDLQEMLCAWNEEGIEFLGIIHSHMDSPELSGRDIAVAMKILSINPMLETILMPVFVVKKQKIFWYKVSNHKVHLITVDIKS